MASRCPGFATLVAAIAMSWGAIATGNAQAPAQPPELRVLDRFVGTWDYEVTTRAAAWTPRAGQSRGTNTTQWTLGGWYLEERGRDPDGSESLGLWSYDSPARVYRAWLFLPGGNAATFASRWDESAQAFRGAADVGNGITRTTTHHFVDRDTCEWTIVAKDRAGKVYLDIAGTNRRRR